MKDNLDHIALLIDADNTQLSKLEGVIQEISKHGRIVVNVPMQIGKRIILKTGNLN